MPPKTRKQKEPEPDLEPDYMDDDEVDDVSEDEVDGEDEKGQFIPAESLGEIHWHRRSCNDLVDLMSESEYFDLNPDYQRDVVWKPERMTKLINSLLSGYYVPPLIFNVVEIQITDGQRRFKRVSIDGKQRLSSIREFVRGNIPTTDIKNRRWYFTDNGESGKRKRILPVHIKRKFLNLDFLCAEYMELERRQEEDLFARVQLGIPLTPAEKLRASSGPWQFFAIEIEKKYQELLSVVDNKRGRGFQLILQVLKQIIQAADEKETYSAGATALKGFCDKARLLDDGVRRTAERVFRRYNEVFQKCPDTFENHNYSHATKFSPIEFVGVGVLIHRRPDRNANMLRGDILAMREYIRVERQDLRSNTDTWKCIMSFINEIERYRGGVGVIDAPQRKRPTNASSRKDPPEGRAESDRPEESPHLKFNSLPDYLFPSSGGSASPTLTTMHPPPVPSPIANTTPSDIRDSSREPPNPQLEKKKTDGSTDENRARYTGPPLILGRNINSTPTEVRFGDRFRAVPSSNTPHSASGSAANGRFHGNGEHKRRRDSDDSGRVQIKKERVMRGPFVLDDE